jgi:hypothetical protein
MNAEQYQRFFEVFEPIARSKLAQLAGILTRQHGRVVTDVGSVVNQGFGFLVDNNRSLFAELMLNGAECGFEGVSLVLNCSVLDTGQVWSPGKHTPLVWIKDRLVLSERLSYMDVQALAGRIQKEWLSVEAAQEDQRSQDAAIDAY